MSIEFTELKGSDTIAAMRIILNQNFNVSVAAINSLGGFLDTDGKSLSNIESLSVTKGETNITETLISTNGSITLGGNLIASGSIKGQSLEIESDITINSGDILISSPNKKIELKGDFWLDGEYVLTDYTTPAFDASNELTFENNNGDENLIYDGGTAIGGYVSADGRSAMVMSWEEFVDTADAQFYLHKISFKTSPTTVKTGQMIKIIAKINEDIDLADLDGNGYWILRDCLAYTTGNPITTGIKFTKSYQTATLIFNGENWVIDNLYGATVI